MKILLLANYDGGLYLFREEIVRQLLVDGHDVYLSVPSGEYIEYFVQMGCHFIDTPMQRRGTNPRKDFQLFCCYMRILKRVRPHCVFAYTIKPNLYGGLAAAWFRIPMINNITGLGTAFADKSMLRNILIFFYRQVLQRAACVFFQNEENQRMFHAFRIRNFNEHLLPGSGVNLTKHSFEFYPTGNNIKFLFVGRLMKDKGIEEYVEAARKIRKIYINTEFHVIGFCELNYQEKMTHWTEEKIVFYHGLQKNVHQFMKEMHCIIHPSHHEGMANVLLEAAACSRPVIASNISGCKETFEDTVSGYGFQVGNVEDLVEKIKGFLELTYEQKKTMGCKGRKFVERSFDRQFVVQAYLEEIEKIYLGSLQNH